MHFPPDNSVGSVWNWMVDSLSAVYPAAEAKAIVSEVFEQSLFLTSAGRVLRANERLSESTLRDLQLALGKLLAHTPVQYVTGRAHFLDIELEVDPRVLIPRNETEELVMWVQETLAKEGQGKKILDIGSGSGCIAISLARMNPGAEVTACDIYPEILELVQRNAEKNGTDIRVMILDVLHDDVDFQGFDVVVSNPPYVRQQEKAQMQQNVLGYEPAVALFVEDSDPLIFYRVISRKAFKWLRSGGYLFFEINEFLGPQTLEVVRSAGFADVQLRQDIHGKDRFIRAVKK